MSVTRAATALSPNPRPKGNPRMCFAPPVAIRIASVKAIVSNAVIRCNQKTSNLPRRRVRRRFVLLALDRLLR
jgi:hypothetical protein